jgi:hypothetical protein
MYGKNKSSRQIFHAALIKTLICYALHISSRIFYCCLPCCTDNLSRTNAQVYRTHFRFFKLLNIPVESVSRWCSAKRELLIVLSLHSKRRINRWAKGFRNKHFLFRLIRPRIFLPIQHYQLQETNFPLCRWICEFFTKFARLTEKSYTF